MKKMRHGRRHLRRHGRHRFLCQRPADLFVRAFAVRPADLHDKRPESAAARIRIEVALLHQNDGGIPPSFANGLREVVPLRPIHPETVHVHHVEILQLARRSESKRVGFVEGRAFGLGGFQGAGEERPGADAVLSSKRPAVPVAPVRHVRGYHGKSMDAHLVVAGQDVSFPLVSGKIDLSSLAVFFSLVASVHVGHVDHLRPQPEVLLDGEVQRQHVPAPGRPAGLTYHGSSAPQHPHQPSVPLLVHLDAAQVRLSQRSRVLVRVRAVELLLPELPGPQQPVMVQKLAPGADARGGVRPSQRTPGATSVPGVDPYAFVFHVLAHVHAAPPRHESDVGVVPAPHPRLGAVLLQKMLVYPHKVQTPRPDSRHRPFVHTLPIFRVFLTRRSRVAHAAQEYLLGVVRVRKRGHRAADEPRRLHGFLQPPSLVHVSRIHLKARPRSRPQHLVKGREESFQSRGDDVLVVALAQPLRRGYGHGSVEALLLERQPLTEISPEHRPFRAFPGRGLEHRLARVEPDPHVASLLDDPGRQPRPASDVRDQKRTRRVHRPQHEEVQRALRQLSLDLVVLRRVPPRLADVVVRVRVAAASILRPRDPGSRARPGLRPSSLTHGGRPAQCRLNLLETRKMHLEMENAPRRDLFYPDCSARARLKARTRVSARGCASRDLTRERVATPVRPTHRR